MKHLISIFVAIFALPGTLSAADHNLSESAHPMINPGKSYETCMWISAGSKLQYEFTAKSSLRFNIHYHSGKKVHYPVLIEQTSSETGLFEPDSRKNYCLMWRNTSDLMVMLNLKHQVKR